MSLALADAQPLVGLTQLTRLELGGAMTNTDALGSLINLTYLRAYAVGLTSASSLAGMTKLVHLDLGLNQISDLAPLSSLTNLLEVSLIYNTFSSLTPLVANTGIGSGDSIDLTQVALSCTTEKANLDALTNRGVSLVGAPTCP